jgi:soluble lytic murein transglycosylase-like protein
MIRRHVLLCALATAFALSSPALAQAPSSALNALVTRHARANNVPEELVHRIIFEESRYHPRAIGRGGAMGLMQIKYSTARGLGYRGPPAGLLNPDTNLTWAVRYLAGAYRMAQGDQDVARILYGTGY